MAVTAQTGRRSERINAQKLTGILKLSPRAPKKYTKGPRIRSKYFWYRDRDGSLRVATSSNDPDFPPLQINTLDFNPAHFATEPYPTTFPLGLPWPPQSVNDILCSLGLESSDCVGDECYTHSSCYDPDCRHSFNAWARQTEAWEDHFELRMTPDRGIGVFTKREFERGHVLGFYAGEVLPLVDEVRGDYLMQVDVGFMPIDELSDEEDGRFGYGDDEYLDRRPSFPLQPIESVYIDGGRKGNWTRFINHSCQPYCIFRIGRVGTTRVMVVETVCDVPAGVELTVSYGEEYYGQNTTKVCRCGTANCVGRERWEDEGRQMIGEAKARVKKCKRLSPP